MWDWQKVEELERENARLRAENERLFTANGELANTLGAENLRLRGALMKCQSLAGADGPPDAIDACDEIEIAAKAALTNGDCV